MVETFDADDAPSFSDFDPPISHARVHDGTVYVSGQAGISPETNELVDGGVAAETRQTVENVAVVLDAADSSLDALRDATIHLADLSDFDAVNDAYAEFVSDPYPARSAVEVSELARDFGVEIEATAAVTPAGGGGLD